MLYSDRNMIKRVCILVLILLLLTMSAGVGESWLAFTSDPHNGGKKISDETCSAYRLDNWINAVADLNDCTFDYLCINGDLGSPDVSGSTYWDRVKVLIAAAAQNSNVNKTVFIAGNHEYENGLLGEIENDITVKIEPNGKVYEDSDYVIYCFGATSKKLEYTDTAISQLESFLKIAPVNKQIFILSHYPLHYYQLTVKNCDTVISLINQYAPYLDIVYLWGHTHAYADKKYGKFFTDTINGQKIQFIYAAAGCMSDTELSSNSGKIKEKGLIAHITEQGFTMTYYDKNGETCATYSKVKPTGIINFKNDEYILYTESDVNCCKADIEYDGCEKIQYYSRDEDIATIDEEGYITAHKEGKTKIIAVTGDGLKAETSVTVVSEPDLFIAVSEIGNYAFSNDTAFRYIFLKNGIASIGNGAFSGCSKATLINIPESVTEIGEEAFENCDNLIILCSIGSYAYQYAIAHNMQYVELHP